MYLIDTDVLSALRRRHRHPGVVKWLSARRTSELFLSVVSIGEIARDIALQRGKDRAFAQALEDWLDQLFMLYGDRILPIDRDTARRWGRLSAAMGNDGADLLIAATALENGLTVVTRNVRHFAPTGVAVFDPFDAG